MAEHIYFEGMDLSGKSSTAQGFIDGRAEPWQIYHNNLSGDNPIARLADTLREDEVYDAEVIGNLYTCAIMGDLRNYRKPTVNTVQDSSTAMKSLAYHTVRSTPRLVELIQHLTHEHPRFDAAFYFAASMEARRERLDRRMVAEPDLVSSDDLLIIRNPQQFEVTEKVLREWTQKIFGAVVIDTSNATPLEVVSMVGAEYSRGKEL